MTHFFFQFYTFLPSMHSSSYFFYFRVEWWPKPREDQYILTKPVSPSSWEHANKSQAYVWRAFVAFT